MTKDAKLQAQGPAAGKPAPAEPLRLEVTLVRKNEYAWDVLDRDGKPLKCACGRPIDAVLHNVSVKERLAPCTKVVPKLG